MQREDKVKTHLKLPRVLLNELDRVISCGKRSELVADATRKKLERIRLDKAIEKAAGTWRDEDYPELRTKADVRKYLRRLRRRTNLRLQRRLRG